MAFLASRSVDTRKTDGLLARVGELCGIIRASYLSPFFPLVLGFELWRYLRPQLQAGDRAVPTRNNRFSLRLLRGAAFGVTLMLPAKGWAQGDGTPASPQTPAKTSETSEEVLKREERQRILGVVPNFNTVESSDGVPPFAGTEVPPDVQELCRPICFCCRRLCRRSRPGAEYQSRIRPGSRGLLQALWGVLSRHGRWQFMGQCYPSHPPQGGPALFSFGSGSFTHRFLYSASTTVWCKRDNGTWGPNYANVLGNFISGGISNAYYPAADRGVEQTLDGALTVTAEGVIGAEFVEFWPDISRHLFKKHHAGTVRSSKLRGENRLRYPARCVSR